jgi:hypothetical protein
MLITGVHLLAWLLILGTGIRFVESKTAGTPFGAALAFIY